MKYKAIIIIECEDDGNPETEVYFGPQVSADEQDKIPAYKLAQNLIDHICDEQKYPNVTVFDGDPS